MTDKEILIPKDEPVAPPELNLALLREKAAARRMKRELTIVMIGSVLSSIALLMGLGVLISHAPQLQLPMQLLYLAAGLIFTVISGNSAAIICFLRRREKA